MRVRFLKHVMGLPGPEPVYHEGQVAELPRELAAVLEASMVGHHASDWFVEYAGAVERCPTCENDFTPNDIVTHRVWFHGEHPQRASGERRNKYYPDGEGDYGCIACSRSFATESGIKRHWSTVHRGAEEQLKSGTGPP